MTTTLTHNEQAEVQFFANRRRHPGWHYKLFSDSNSLAIELSGQPYVDRSAMSARAVISTPTVDRVGDLLIPCGCRTTNYALNPVVLWAHGLEGVGHPIGTSQDAQGQLAIDISDDQVQATCWFSQSSLEAAQVFELIDEGIVRATSVRETPIKCRIRHDPEAGDVLIVEEWDLEEWSWCAVGVNPDAVAKAIHRNRLGGQPITESILKSLQNVAPNSKRLGVGLPKEKNLTELNQTDDDNSNTSARGLTAMDDGGDGESNEIPYGSTVVSAVHTSLSNACQNIQDAMRPLENPGVKEGLQSILVALQEQMAAVEGLHATSYPDQPSLKADQESGDDDGEATKAFLASGGVSSLQVLGLGARLKGLIGARNLTQSQRRILTGVAQQLAKVVSQSKSHRSVSDEARIDELQDSIRELTELVSALSK